MYINDNISALFISHPFPSIRVLRGCNILDQSKLSEDSEPWVHLMTLDILQMDSQDHKKTLYETSPEL